MVGCFLVAEQLAFDKTSVNGEWPQLMFPVTLPTSRTLASAVLQPFFCHLQQKGWKKSDSLEC